MSKIKTLADHQKELEIIAQKKNIIFEKYQKDPNEALFIKNILLINYNGDNKITSSRIDGVISECIVKKQTNPLFSIEKKTNLEEIMRKFYNEHPTKNNLTQLEKDSNNTFESVCDQVGRTIEAL